MFIHDREIDKIEGNKVIFKDWGEANYTETQLKYIVTEEDLDDNQFRNLILENVAEDVLGVLQKHNIRKWDLSPIIETVISSFNQNFLIAVWKAFGTYSENKYPAQMQEDITMEDIIQMKDK